MKLSTSRILVTGGGVRIGKAISLALAKAGAEVLIHYRKSSDAAEETAEMIRTRGGKADTVSGDVATEAGVQLIMDQAMAKGPLDGLVNNAAVFNRTPLAASHRQTFMEELGPNLLGPLELLRLFAAQGRKGAVVNILDRRIAAHDAGAVPYQLSKVALAEATRLAALEFGPRLRVNGVAPGAILPPPGREDELDYMEKNAGNAPLDHGCSPEDVAGAVVYLIQAPAITGQILFVDAGQHLLGNGV
ncbi:SDR family oxidoreductase [Kiritimatiellaeota bacterium B1221]|nr:SDR family oxidoreductase [Kiritimatiellaeota bacterium B1221]